MKFAAFITKTRMDNKAEISLNFYAKSTIGNEFNVITKNGEIQIKKILPIADWDSLYKSTYLPSNDSIVLDTPYSLEINRTVEPLINDALNLMTSQQRYEFFEELFKTINKEEMAFDAGTCHIESPWLRVNGRHIRTSLKVFRYVDDNHYPKEFHCITHNCIATKEKIRELFYKETFSNNNKYYEIKNFLQLANPLNFDEISELINYAPDIGDFIAVANFTVPIMEAASIDFNNPGWDKIIKYINHHRFLGIQKIVEIQNLDEDLKILDILKKYMNFIPINNSKDVSALIKAAPLSNNIISAKKFINIITESKYFNSQLPTWNEMIDYIEKYKTACVEILNKTNNSEDYELILETSLNDFIWKNGTSEFREILIDRIENQSTGNLDETIQSFILKDACSLFPNALSENITERLIKHFASNSHLYEVMSSENQILFFNLYSAITCQKVLLNENDTETKVAIDYANERMIETMRSVKWDVEKAIKKSASMLKRNEHRAVAALINKIATDLNYYFSKSLITEIYSELLLPHNPHYDWISLCENLPFINSSFSIREGLARYFLSTGDVKKAKPHVAAIMSFEPNSKIAAELHSLLSRETAIKSLAEDGVNIETIDKMTGIEFEKILIKKLQKIGFKVTETPGSGDYGADIVIDDEDETRFIIQCKRFNSKVNLKAVQEIVAAMKHYSADYAIVATNSEFLKSAVELAKSNDVELWAGAQVMQVLSGDISSTVLVTATLPVPVDSQS
jgi:hypothetical protein